MRLDAMWFASHTTAHACRQSDAATIETTNGKAARGPIGERMKASGRRERHYSCRDEGFEPTMKPRSRTDRGWHLQLERDGCRQK
jgi:hypothetical protein